MRRSRISNVNSSSTVEEESIAVEHLNEECSDQEEDMHLDPAYAERLDEAEHIEEHEFELENSFNLVPFAEIEALKKENARLKLLNDHMYQKLSELAIKEKNFQNDDNKVLHYTDFEKLEVLNAVFCL